MNTRSLRIFLPVIIVLLTLASLRERSYIPRPVRRQQSTCPERSAKASSVASGGSTYVANRAVDGSTTTRWMSKAVDPSWIYVDLKQVRTFTRVRLNWGTAYGKAYQLQVSDNATVWTTIYTQANGAGGIDDIAGFDSRRSLRAHVWHLTETQPPVRATRCGSLRFTTRPRPLPRQFRRRQPIRLPPRPFRRRQHIRLPPRQSRRRRLRPPPRPFRRRQRIRLPPRQSRPRRRLRPRLHRFRPRQLLHRRLARRST